MSNPNSNHLCVETRSHKCWLETGTCKDIRQYDQGRIQFLTYSDIIRQYESISSNQRPSKATHEKPQWPWAWRHLRGINQQGDASGLAEVCNFNLITIKIHNILTKKIRDTQNISISFLQMCEHSWGRRYVGQRLCYFLQLYSSKIHIEWDHQLKHNVWRHSSHVTAKKSIPQQVRDRWTERWTWLTCTPSPLCDLCELLTHFCTAMHTHTHTHQHTQHTQQCIQHYTVKNYLSHVFFLEQIRCLADTAVVKKAGRNDSQAETLSAENINFHRYETKPCWRFWYFFFAHLILIRLESVYQME